MRPPTGKGATWPGLYLSAGLIIPYVVLNPPFAICGMGNYLVGIPKELEEAATVDVRGRDRTARLALGRLRDGLGCGEGLMPMR